MVLHQDGVQELPGIQELLILLQCGNQSQHDVRYYIYYLVLIVIKPFCWLLVLTGFNPNFSSSNVWTETSVMLTWTFYIFQEFNQLWSVTTLKTCIILYACKLILNLNDDSQIRQLSGAYRIGQEKTDNFVGKHFYIVLDYACSIFFFTFHNSSHIFVYAMKWLTRCVCLLNKWPSCPHYRNHNAHYSH